MKLVLQDIRKQVKLAKLGDEAFIQYLTKANQQRQNAKVKKMTIERAKSNKRFVELDHNHQKAL
jgi:hypothetical protein